MRTPARLALVVAGLALAGSPSQAQEPRLLEIGMDAGVTFGLDDPRVTVVSIPFQNFRIGFAMGEQTSLEPSFSLTSVSGSGSTLTLWNLGLGVLWHFRDMRSGTYLRPFVDLSGVSGSGTSDTQVAIGTGFGVKIPVADGRVAWRLEANFAHAFESDNRPDSNRIGLLAGLSFFTR